MLTTFLRRVALALLLSPAVFAVHAQATNLFISEYVEGTGTNKAIEIYNGTGSAVDLAAGVYRLELYSNGSATATAGLNLTGTIAAGDVLVLCNATDVGITSRCDVTNTSVINFNGDDALVLKANGVIIDSLGQVGVDPGTNWGTGLTSTLDHTLRRKDSVCAGDTNTSDAFDPSWDWDGYANGTYDGLGVHTGCGGGGGSPTLSISDQSADEGDSGTKTFLFTISSTQAAPAGGISVDYATSDGTTNPATAGSDYVATSGTATIAENATSVTIGVTVNGDTTVEPNETFFVDLSNPVGATINDGHGVGTINNDDVAITPIHDVQGSGLVSPMTGANVTLEGIVTATTGSGYFLQEEDADADADSTTSEGIFVFTNNAPPAAAAVGNKVRAYGQVQEFVPANTFNQSYTELGNTPVTTLMTTGNALPTSIDLNAALAGADYSTPVLERYEAMRVSSNDLDIVAPSGGSIDETNATSTSDGNFFAVIPGIARPFREPGVPQHELDVAAANAYAAPKYDNYNGYTGPAFDENWERIRVRATSPAPLSVGTGDAVGNLQGVLDVFGGNYTLLVDPAVNGYTGPILVADHQPTAARLPADDEITVSGANLERFWDTVDDVGKLDEVPTSTAYENRLSKDARVICQMMHAPDILGTVEVENITVLQDLATHIDDIANSGCATAPHYQAYLLEGNDVGGIDAGYLVKTEEVAPGVPRVAVNGTPTQIGLCTLLKDANGNPITATGTAANGCAQNGTFLNDRPSLILDATVNAANGAHEDLTVIVNHLKALSGVNSTKSPGSNGYATDGARNRAKRLQQATELANTVQGLQTGDPNKRIVMVGDFNSFQFSDGLVDVMGIVTGTASTNDSDTVVPGDGGSEIVTSPLMNLMDLKPANERYSYSFDGNAQVLDQALVNQPMADAFGLDVDHPRINGDFPVSDFGDFSAGSITRISDHDPVVVYLSTTAFLSADLEVAAGATPTTTMVGSQVTFDASVTNNGPDAANAPGVGFAFDHALPDLQVTGIPSGWTCGAPQISGDTTSVSCNASSLAVSATASFTLTASADAATLPGSLQMAVSATSADTDTDSSSNHATAAVTVNPLPSADLSTQILRTSTQNTSTLNFRIPVTNNGPDAAYNPHLVITGNIGGSPVVSAPSGWSCRRIAGSTVRVECNRNSSMAAGTTQTFYLSMPIPTTYPALQFNATISSTTRDPNTNNNAGAYSGQSRLVIALH